MESHLSLGSPSIMYQGREGGFEAHLYKPTKRLTNGDHKVMLAKFAQATPTSCVTQGSGAREDSMVGHPTSQSTTIERESETASEAELGRKHPCIGTQSHCLGALWQVGKISSPFRTFNKKRPSSHRLHYYRLELSIQLLYICVFSFSLTRAYFSILFPLSFMILSSPTFCMLPIVQRVDHTL